MLNFSIVLMCGDITDCLLIVAKRDGEISALIGRELLLNAVRNETTSPLHAQSQHLCERVEHIVDSANNGKRTAAARS